MDNAGVVCRFESAGDLARDTLDAVDVAQVVNPDDMLLGDLAREQELFLNRFWRSGDEVPASPTRITFGATATPSAVSHAWYTALDAEQLDHERGPRTRRR